MTSAPASASGCSPTRRRRCSTTRSVRPIRNSRASGNAPSWASPSVGEEGLHTGMNHDRTISDDMCLSLLLVCCFVLFVFVFVCLMCLPTYFIIKAHCDIHHNLHMFAKITATQISFIFRLFCDGLQSGQSGATFFKVLKSHIFLQRPCTNWCISDQPCMRNPPINMGTGMPPLICGVPKNGNPLVSPCNKNDNDVTLHHLDGCGAPNEEKTMCLPIQESRWMMRPPRYDQSNGQASVQSNLCCLAWLRYDSSLDLPPSNLALEHPLHMEILMGKQSMSKWVIFRRVSKQGKDLSNKLVQNWQNARKDWPTVADAL